MELLIFTEIYVYLSESAFADYFQQVEVIDGEFLLDLLLASSLSRCSLRLIPEEAAEESYNNHLKLYN